jgi:putative transposase
VIRDAAGRHFASFVVNTEPDILAVTDADTGIDLGLSCFAAFPDGRTITAPKFLRRSERTLTRLQRALCRKQRGSRNRTKARIRLARAHARVGGLASGLASQGIHQDHPR